MTEMEETGAVYCTPGYTIKLKLKVKLRQLIMRERRKSGVALEDIGRQIGVSPEKLKALEDYHKLVNWFILDRLLHFYHKKIEL